MKRFVKIFLGVLGGILLLLFLLPFLFKGKIEAKVKDAINEQVNATVSWNRFSLSMFRHFPNLGMGLDGLLIVNQEPFEGDTLLYVGNFALSVDVWKAVTGKGIEINSILINQPLVNLKVNGDSIANWDIVPVSDEVAVEDTTATETSDFQLKLKSFEIRNASLAYSDKTMNFSTAITGLNALIKGDMSASYTNLDIAAKVDALNLTYDNVRYLRNAFFDLKALVGADLDKMVFTFQDNELNFNKIPLFMEGTFAMLDEGYDMDLKLAARETQFKTILALVPDVYMKDLDGLKTSGSFVLEATAKGVYVDTDRMPAFNVLLDVKDGFIQYPELPKSIDNIGVHLLVNNPGGSMDQTVTEIKTFHFELDKNPFDAHLLVTNPISNATFKGGMKGNINLASLKQAMPMDSIEMKGIVRSDLSLEGNYAMIEKEQYEDIKANGNVVLEGFEFKSPDLPNGIVISEANMQFSPRFVELKSFQSQLGESDFGLTGRLENYLAYALKDGVLKGNLAHHSKFINANELMGLAPAETEEQPETSEPIGKVLVPSNLNFVMTSKVDRLLYDKLELTNTMGSVKIQDSRIILEGLKTDLLRGQMVMTGEYNTRDTLKPFVDFNLAISSIDINKAAYSISMVEKMLPIAKNASGLVSSNFRFNSVIGDDFSPVLNTINGGGMLKSSGIEVKGAKVQDALTSALKNDKYKVAAINDLLVNFAIDNGNLIVRPFDVNVFGKKINMYGRQSVDQTMDFNIKMPVTRSEISNVAGLLGGSIPTSGDDLMVGVAIGGSITDPKLRFVLDDAKSQIKDELKQEVEKAAEKAAEKIMSDPEVQKKVDEVGNKLKRLLR